MKQILVLQHVAHEILGTLNPILKDRGFRIRYVNYERDPDYVPKMEKYDGMIILGGPMSVNDTKNFPHLLIELEAIEQALKLEIPILGICLGAQLISKTLGGKINNHVNPEIGWYDVNLTEEGQKDEVFEFFKPTEKIFQWHEDTFSVPREAKHLAYSDTCENQAFKYGDRVYGFQFHMEVDEPMIERWLTIPNNVRQMEDWKIDPEGIRKVTHGHIDHLKELSDKTFHHFLDLFGGKRKSLVLGSGHR